MDRSDRKSKKERKRPRIPIKTYRWEEVRRARKKGGYPWTYLYKQPFDEEVDVETYTMEGMRKAKSSSTMGRSDGERSDWGKSDLEISEFSDMESSIKSGENPEKMDTLQIVSDPDNHSSKNSSNSVNIEEIEASDKNEQIRENIIESAESWDNISQYLDKEERVPTNHKAPETEDIQMPEVSKENAINKKIDEKNEETNKRKRKLSAESSYSRISQTKLALMKKLNETKKKIKVPKITFSVSKLKKPKSIPAKQKNSPPETKKEIKKSSTQPLKNIKPVYIHIPLKPPPGESEQFSYPEFGGNETKKETPKKPGSFRDLVKNIKQLQEQNEVAEPQKSESDDQPKIANTSSGEIAENSLQNEESVETSLNKEHENKQNTIDNITTTEKMENILPEEENKENVDVILNKEQDDKRNNLKLENVQDSANKEEVDDNITNADTARALFKKCEKYTKSVEEDSDTDIQQKEEENDVASSNLEKKEEDIFEHLFQASASKPATEVLTTSSSKNVRSKSEEPDGRKRKLSMESSYSRKSLSKLNFLKTLKDASEKIKNTLTRSESKKKAKAKQEEAKKIKDDEAKTIKNEEKKEEKKLKQLKPSKTVEPVYIHIPLKPKEGETDEFSYLENAEKPKESVQTPVAPATPPSQDSPVQTGPEGVQFIMLTAPSDDEILDYNSSDVCDTPSSENKLFFPSKVTELKQLAKDVVNDVEGSKKLESVEEESNGDEGDKKSLSSEKNVEAVKDIVDKKPESFEKIDKTESTVKEETSKVDQSFELKAINNQESETKETQDDKTINDIKEPKVTIDEEDGLNETKPAKLIENKNAETKEEPTEPSSESTDLKSSLKCGGSPIVKKKVSFKRRSRTSKDGSYEDIQSPDLHLDLGKSDETSKDETEQTISVIGKAIGDTSLEDDKWSKTSDHEYEPVNPPPDNLETYHNAPPQVYVIDTDYDSSILPLGSVSFETTVPTTENVPKDKTEIKTIQPENSNSASTSASSTKKQASASSDKSKEGPSKFQLAFRQKKENFKNKLHNLKKPHITMPDRPKFSKPDFKKFKIEKPKLNLPKIPDTTKINLPHFSLQRKHSGKRSLKERQLSTESNDGDSKKPIFDFSTYPRIFKKKAKAKQSDAGASNFATVPRTKKSEKPQQESSSKWSGSDSIRIPLHSEDSMDNGHEPNINTYLEHREDNERYDEDVRDEDSPIRQDESSHIRYGEDIDIDDDYGRENDELNRERDFITRWDHGRFNEEFNEEYLQNLKNSNYKVTDLDSPEDNADVGYDYNSNEQNKDRYSSGSSFGQRRGVMEEINSDEFFWRPKGISQDDIHISMNISSEIREAFRTPANALVQIENIDDYRFNSVGGSQQSLPEVPPKRKPIKKPKRKKTPHTSQERIPRAEESADDDLDTYPPSRPKRRSKRKKKDKNTDEFIPYRETISVDVIPTDEDRFNEHRESIGMLGDDEQDEEITMYENERMEGIDQPEIKVTDPYSHFEFADEDQEVMVQRPAAPPRKQKSVKSLNLSENDSLLDDFSSTRAISGEVSIMKDVLEPEIEAIRTDSKVIIPIVQEVPPRRPSRTLSRTNSRSVGTSLADEGSISRGTSQIDEQSISKFDVEENLIPCVEEPCFQDIRDPMGYAVIDKSKIRDPPLPPPRTLTRQKRTHKADKGNKFNTVPRSSDDVPMRPLRNYSTLGQAKKAHEANEYENKENIDILQYIEIDDEPNRNLQSGDVIKKMKDRPLPAPPRPPRRGRPLRDITSEENIMAEFLDDDDIDKLKLDEIEVSTQTEPLPDDFVCEEVVQEPSDRVLIPSTSSYEKSEDIPNGHSSEVISRRNQDIVPKVEKRLITPTFYTHEETITHGSLLVEPLNGAKILPDSEMIKHSRERIIPITRESEDETSSIPDEFHKFSDPTSDTKKLLVSGRTAPSNEFEVLRAHKLQVTDLDVDQLRVNQLTASKIVVSEIDSGSIHTNEIGSKGGALTVGEINLPPSVIDQIIKSIKSSSETLRDETSEAVSGVQKKTSTTEKPREIVQIETLIEEIMEVEEIPGFITKEIPQSPKNVSSLENLEIQINTKHNEQLSSFPLNLEPADNAGIESSHSQEHIINIDLDQNLEPLSPQATNILEHENQLDGNLESITPQENQDQSNIEPVSAQGESMLQYEDQADPQTSILQNQDHPDSVEQANPPIPLPRSTSESVVIQHQILDEGKPGISQSYTFEDEAQTDSPDNLEIPPRPPPRSIDSENLEMPPIRPPREKHRRGSISTLDESIQEPEVDDEPPPRPPDPQMEYIPSQPPASFYALKAQKYVDENIPAAPRRRRHRRSKPRSRSRSSSEDSSSVSRRPHRRSSEPSVSQLTSQLARTASTEISNNFKRLIDYIMNNVLGNADGKQDLNVMILIVLVLIAGLILLGHDDERTVVHFHHWEYFNPPRDL